MTKRIYKLLGVTALIASSNLLATPITTTSLTSGGALASGITEIGGVVLDLIGKNGNRVTSQVAASTLFEGFAATNPFVIGTQNGFSSAITSSLGGGIAEAAIRVTLFDGDNAMNDFDYNQNTLILNDISFGDWSHVNTQSTDSSGTVAGSFSGGGFRNELLDTGWFFSDNLTLLDQLFTSIVSTQSVIYQMSDIDPGDNYFDFSQGINGSLINVGTGPSVTPVTVPEPSTLALFILGLAGIFSRNKLKHSKT